MSAVHAGNYVNVRVLQCCPCRQSTAFTGTTVLSPDWSEGLRVWTGGDGAGRVSVLSGSHRAGGWFEEVWTDGRFPSGKPVCENKGEVPLNQ